MRATEDTEYTEEAVREPIAVGSPRQDRIVLAGGSGFLGQVLAGHFTAQGTEVVVLTRGAARVEGAVRFVQWDGSKIGPWIAELEHAAALINLAGRSVDCRYHARNRRLIMDSRVDSTRILNEAVRRCQAPPPVWLNSSTATIYRHTHGGPWDENGEIAATPEAKDHFSVEVAKAWEKAFFADEIPGVRKVALRSAMVLGHGRNSVFPVLRRLVRFGLGGAMAGGEQFVSWIHHADFSRAIDWLIEQPTLSGCVNLAAPNPLPNHGMMRVLRRVCRAPFSLGLPAPRWLLEVGTFFLRTETELVVKSRRVVPDRLLRSGFRFRFEEFEKACLDLNADARAS